MQYMGQLLPFVNQDFVYILSIDYTDPSVNSTGACRSNLFLNLCWEIILFVEV